MGSCIHIGDIGRVGIECFTTLSEDKRLIVTSQLTNETGRAVSSIFVTSLIIETDLEYDKYSELGSDSTMASVLINSFLTFFNSPFIVTEEGVFFSEQLDTMWSILILPQNQHPLFLLRYSCSDSMSLEEDLTFPIEDLDIMEQVAALLVEQDG